MAEAALRQPPIERERAPLRVIPGHGGGPPSSWSQPAVASAQIAIIVVIVFESMIFAGLTSAYLVLRTSSFLWPPPDLPRLPIALTWVNTMALLASAVTMYLAVRSVVADRQAQFRRQLILTALLGTAFLVVQGSEWTRLIAGGLTMSVHVYGATFYSLIGFHALHVLVAVIWLLTLLGFALGGRFNARHHGPVKVCATYWYFVSVLWVFLFVIVYLI